MCSIDIGEAANSSPELSVEPTNWEKQFPPELTLRVMELLLQKDLRTLSETCSSFRRLAHAAGLYIPLTVIYRSYGDRDSLTTLDSVLDHVTATSDSPLNLAITARFIHWSELPTDFKDDIQGFIASIQRALPYLVRLRLFFPLSVTSTVYAALNAHEAPRLRDLTILHQLYDPPFVARDLFQGNAPLLRRVSIDLSRSEPLSVLTNVAAFREVTYLRLTIFRAEHCLVLARLFPVLRYLVLKYGTPSEDQLIDLRGLQLQRASLSCACGGDITGILTDASALVGIPVVEYNIPAVEYAAQAVVNIWPAQFGALCARVERYGFGCERAISFGPADGSWRRTIVEVNFNAQSEPPPLPAAPEIASKLVSLTVDKSLVFAFIRTSVTLDALRELFVDLSSDDPYSWPSRDNPFYGERMIALEQEFEDSGSQPVRCPALLRVVIFAVPSDGKPVTVSPATVAHPGRALIVCGCSPALILAGCTFADVPMPPEVHEIFSAVDFAESAGDCVPEYSHTCRYSKAFSPEAWV
ncbi:hypothetical protein AURDEDRAFT_131190 [Auricularia subglabra TFB-10046 SS5]|uniref:F-box domain-containing protein n=1 Tax=Auricularia subglabra (strain TFB-10046 / SS5) TaxID=717982 RepID=J0WPP7_AURST|nr:hypothetical protein AURDEDRAFT_131190 [Auricularia subglabra TFB-10046 SS5]